MTRTHDEPDSTASSVSEAVLEAALEAIFTIDADGVVRYMNRAAEEMFALERETALGQRLGDLIVPPDLRDAHLAGLKRLAEGGSPKILGNRLEMRGLRSDGAQFPVELTVTKSSEDPPEYTGFVRDLSAIKEEGRQRARIERLRTDAEELAAMGSFEIDLRTRELVWSDGLYRLNGYEPGEIELTLELGIGRIHPDDQDRISAQVGEMFESPRPMTAEYRIQLDDGTIQHRVADAAIERDEDGDPVRVFGTVQDVTDQRLSERDLQAHYALTQALSEWHSFDEGVVDLLRRLGTAMDWDVASLWVRADRDESLACRALWSAPGEGLSAFERAMREFRIQPGRGVLRRAWDQMEPISVEDMSTDSRVDRTAGVGPEALRAGLRSALFFPAVHDGETLAVVAFNGREPHRLNERLIRTLTSLGHDLGRFLSGRRGEIGLRPLTKRELEVLQLAAEGLSAPMIAERLLISPATVKTHFAHTYEKLGVTDRAAAVAEGMRQGLIT